MPSITIATSRHRGFNGRRGRASRVELKQPETHTASDLFGSSSAAGVVDARAHAGGFWVAGMSGTWSDTPTSAVDYVDLDLTGHVVMRGHYAPMPAEVTLPRNNWTSKYPVIDGHGALYQRGMAADDGVIVKRPMTGQSAIVYRASQWAVSGRHTVMSPEYLVTGGRRSY